MEAVHGRIRMGRIGVVAAAVMLVAVAWAGTAAGDDVSVSAAIEPTTVAVGDQATLTITVQGKFRNSSQPQLPNINGLHIFDAGTSQSFQVTNGHMSSSITYTYVVTADKKGTYSIAPITFTLGDKQYTATPVTLDVTAANSAVPSIPPGAAPPAGAAGPGTAKGGLPDEDQSIYIAARVDRDTVYVNQQVTWTMGYYSDGRVNLLRSPNYSPPEAEGFWVEDLPPQNKYYTTIHGRRYLVNEIKRAYFPTAPGTHAIGKARVDVVIDNLSSRSMVQDFFGRRGFGEAHTLLTEPINVVVLPLPERGKPADFGGAVAEKLSVSLSADKQVVQAGEPVNVTVELNGVGNIKTIAPPKLAKSDKYKLYESGSSSDSFKRQYVVSGRKRYQYVVIPQVAGKWSIPAVGMSYFDPVHRRYEVAQSQGVPLEVKPGAKEEGRKVVYAGSGDDFKVINRDIRYIHPVPSSVALSAPAPYRNKLYLGLHALPLLAVIASLVVERRRRRLRDDVVWARASRALRQANRLLSEARKRFGAGDAEAGFQHLGAAVSGYFADKMNVARAGITGADIDAFLRERSVDENLVAEVRDVLARCDAARYAAGAGGANAGVELLDRTASTLAAVEKGLS